ncbi:hypothetical protein LOTGIDRAFT_236753 [Lottia gigantea]|uniref:Proline-rich transmembrane protein 3/4 domain-containing protein n=1 Tax=Lottia gigantea TaxID=225164 RepID=V4B408_LOTGI|nr:hypothetical protein LOTGIDRAFT_236753 [Lottia gigantea]ESO83149.1 hypothetical protein LOTGIDRAFT_236753 [Lottia gigantea]
MTQKFLIYFVLFLLLGRRGIYAETTTISTVDGDASTPNIIPETSPETSETTNEFAADSPPSSSSPEPSSLGPTPEPSTSPEPETSAEPSTSAEPGTFSEPTTAEPEAESTSKPEPSAESTPEPEAESTDKQEDPLAEPGPDWDVAKEKWSFAWELHIYLYGLFFLCIGIYCCISVVRLWTLDRLLSRKYFLTLNTLIIGMCAIRAIYLLVDGYNSNGTYHSAVDYLMYGLGFPFLTSAFSILMFALLQATRMQMIPRTVQRFEILVTIIVLHFIISITADVVVGLVVGMKIMLLVCQMIFILWGLFLFTGYAYVFNRVYGSAVKRQSMISFSDKSRDSVTSQVRTKPTLSLAVKITLGTAIFGIVTVALEIYSIAAVYGIFSDRKPDPWAWWTYHTFLRLTECLMCLTISYVASQPFRYRTHQNCEFCAPCRKVFCCDNKNRSSENVRWSDVNSQTNTTMSFASTTTSDLKTQESGDDSFRPNSNTLLTVNESYVHDHEMYKTPNGVKGVYRVNSS